jgi:hypothetical protein
MVERPEVAELVQPVWSVENSCLPAQQFTKGEVKYMKIQQWSIISKSDWRFQSPDTGEGYLHGTIVGHPVIEDGKEITTSRIVGRSKDKILTKSGSEYELDGVDPEYEAAFPRAHERLMKRLADSGPPSRLMAYAI